MTFSKIKYSTPEYTVANESYIDGRNIHQYVYSTNTGYSFTHVRDSANCERTYFHRYKSSVARIDKNIKTGESTVNPTSTTTLSRFIHWHTNYMINSYLYNPRYPRYMPIQYFNNLTVYLASQLKRS